ncbi:hypothetical protein BCT47_23505 [Vibrio splendidus]|uniref:Phosphatidylserine/phosphatidylglycerophosphate/ cardiolipin synthase family protein n=1 Tax=Vibrio splendidus TaxID=29497 RepID=A0AB35MXB3_VIBSP|nr:phosphatidylserine/phosphatidylglycerophosphate/cardiolipin synthase family protein [Vibrio splendidus]MDP2501399.1 phosphatidylserine/phosphatidylglycerophosphate/cardiolipin synthase family protein [Vibrio splendidus]PMM74007.1 hypothetical protein BCT47_23505 [Vibrio splendidus]PMO00194.1 hypothetical protein BCT19_23360 [Vibrio splendidus]
MFNKVAPQISSVQKVTKPEKEILWPAQQGFGNLRNGDLTKFPEMEAIISRKHAEKINPLQTFWATFSSAQERLWIIDPYFFNPEKNKGSRQDRIKFVIDQLHETLDAYDIKIITKSHNTITNKNVDDDILRQFKEHVLLLNGFRVKGQEKCNIDIKFNLTTNFDHIHDRFAIIDDELWHFGATVGGFHSQVSAASRGWDASEHGAIEFFNLVWSAEGTVGKK